MTRILTILIGFYIVCVMNAAAQQTVFNVPSADILDKGKVYLEFDASFKPNNQDALRRFLSFVPRFVVGAGGNVEVGLNLIGNVNPGTDATTLVPAVKYRFYQNKKKDLTLFAGNNFYIPVRNKSYNFGTYTYAAVAKSFKTNIRVTAGAFVFSKNVVVQNAARGGGQFSIEQTVNSKLTVSTDWLTGKHSNGYFTPGAAYKFNPQLTGYFAYSIGNADAKKGNHFFLFELGYNF
ncbi:MAG: hypothetical protein LH614_21525 [Pyrinomonadaceae bacterium]|nr:hypothetical protein [Pyrinomonadaceae bacterium]